VPRVSFLTPICTAEDAALDAEVGWTTTLSNGVKLALVKGLD
jgi:hypothetical protein